MIGSIPGFQSQQLDRNRDDRRKSSPTTEIILAVTSSSAPWKILYSLSGISSLSLTLSETKLLACRTGVIFAYFRGTEAEASAKRESRASRGRATRARLALTSKYAKINACPAGYQNPWYTPKQDDQNPRPVQMGVPFGHCACWVWRIVSVFSRYELWENVQSSLVFHGRIPLLIGLVHVVKKKKK